MSFLLPSTFPLITEPQTAQSSGHVHDALESALAAAVAPAVLFEDLAGASVACGSAIALMAEESLLFAESLRLDASPEARATADEQATLTVDQACASDIAVAPVAFADLTASPAEAGLTLSQESDSDGQEDDLPSLPRLTVRRLAMAVGGLLGLGAVTAVAIAPASDVVQPSVRLVVEQVALTTAVDEFAYQAAPHPREIGRAHV